MNIQILVVNIIITRKMTWLVMGLSEKSGWGLKFPTLEPPSHIPESLLVMYAQSIYLFSTRICAIAKDHNGT